MQKNYGTAAETRMLKTIPEPVAWAKAWTMPCNVICGAFERHQQRLVWTRKHWKVCFLLLFCWMYHCLRHQQTSKISKILVSHIRIASQLFLLQNQHWQKSTSKEPWVDLRLLGCPGVWRANCQWSLHMNMVKLLKVLVAECKITLLFLTTCLQKRKCLAQIFVDEYNYGTNGSLTISFCSLRLVENVCAKDYGTLGIGLSYNRSYSKQVSMHVEIICEWSGEESYCSFKKGEWIWFWNSRKHFVWQVW